MGEPLLLPPPGPPILLFLLSLAPGVEAGKPSFQQDLPSEEQYHCRGISWPVPQQDGGIAFLEHPCSPLFLRRQLTLLARACLPHQVRAPHDGPTGHWVSVLGRGCHAREKSPCHWPSRIWGVGGGKQRPPLPLAKAEVAQAVAWLESHLAQQSSEKPLTGGERCHFLKRASAAGRGLCPTHLAQALQKLLQCWEAPRGPRKPWRPGRNRRALRRWAHGLLQAGVGGGRHSAIANPAKGANGGPPPVTLSLQAEQRGIPESIDLGGHAWLSATPLPGGLLGQQPLVTQDIPPSLPVLRTEARAAGGTGCRCPDGGLGKAQGHEGRKEARGSQPGVRVPTPRTEEAAWAASALTFLLVVLTLAVLYTRLHRKCRRGRSLYWTTSTEEGSDTVAAVIKRRLLSAQSRRKKRSRQPQPPPKAPLLPTSSDSSD
ncbi:tumor protein p53-inducible protein 13 [Lacerta agilis]|uniref:tumor protein p53-inducible protein 13 n=1 Tax=Lacerta agilis TaxID=80427 RepID=UPI0014197BFF|nr:tumor protein p53-inducible protein 13 [Lacerta agilis]